MDLNKDILPDHAQRSFWIVYVTATIVLALKLFMSSHVFGSNDVTYWFAFARYIREYGTFNVYSHIAIYNHPPLVSWLLKYLPIQNEAGFPFLLRLLPILADYASIFVIWKLLTIYRSQHKLLICLICSLSPVNFFISGYHGNTDAIFIFLILLTIYLLEIKKVFTGGTIFALSMCIKIVPVIMAPVLFFYLRSRKDRAALCLIVWTVFCVVFLPYLLFDSHSFIRNIFQYGGIKAVWGIGHLLRYVVFNEHYDFQFRQLLADVFMRHIRFFTIPFAVLIFFMARHFMNRRALNLVEAGFLVFSLFLTFTPGFGIQYLSWLSLFAVMVNPLLGAFFVSIGGLFIFRVYAYWGGTVPPYYADSISIGTWRGFDGILDLILWFLVVSMLIRFLYDKKILPIGLKTLNDRSWVGDLRSAFNRMNHKR